jgi:hypothetical protein
MLCVTLRAFFESFGGDTPTGPEHSEIRSGIFVEHGINSFDPDPGPPDSGFSTTSGSLHRKDSMSARNPIQSHHPLALAAPMLHHSRRAHSNESIPFAFCSRIDRTNNWSLCMRDHVPPAELVFL